MQLQLTEKETELIQALRKAKIDATMEEVYFVTHLIPVGEEDHIQQNFQLHLQTLGIDPAIYEVIQSLKSELAVTQAHFLICNDLGFLRTWG